MLLNVVPVLRIAVPVSLALVQRISYVCRRKGEQRSQTCLIGTLSNWMAQWSWDKHTEKWLSYNSHSAFYSEYVDPPGNDRALFRGSVRETWNICSHMQTWRNLWDLGFLLHFSTLYSVNKRFFCWNQEMCLAVGWKVVNRQIARGWKYAENVSLGLLGGNTNLQRYLGHCCTVVKSISNNFF